MYLIHLKRAGKSEIRISKHEANSNDRNLNDKNVSCRTKCAGMGYYVGVQTRGWGFQSMEISFLAMVQALIKIS